MEFKKGVPGSYGLSRVESGVTASFRDEPLKATEKKYRTKSTK